MKTLEEWIKEDEGVRSKPYKDTQGFITIGVGRCLDKKPLKVDEIKYLFANDINDAIADAKTFTYFKFLHPPRQHAIINMCFQLGKEGVAKFRKMNAAIERGDYEKAAKEALDSLWAKQTPNRAKRVAEVIRTGKHAT